MDAPPAPILRPRGGARRSLVDTFVTVATFAAIFIVMMRLINAEARIKEMEGELDGLKIASVPLHAPSCRVDPPSPPPPPHPLPPPPLPPPAEEGEADRAEEAGKRSPPPIAEALLSPPPPIPEVASSSDAEEEEPPEAEEEEEPPDARVREGLPKNRRDGKKGA